MFSTLKRAFKINDLGFFNLNTPQLPSFNLEQFKHHGLPPKISCVSFDSLNILVAGTDDGVLKINGDTLSGSETTLVSEQKAKITFAEIVSETGYVVSIMETAIELWNVNARHLVARKNLDSITSACSVNPQKSTSGSPFRFMYIGDDRGNVRLIKFSETDITLSQPINFDQKGRDNKSITALAVNPKKEEELLVAFASGRVIICNMKTKEVVSEYDFALPENCTCSLSCACWLPSGLQFVCGYANGFLAVSSKKKYQSEESDQPSRPKRFFFVNEFGTEDLAPRTPIKKILSGNTKSGYFLVVLGGALESETKLELFLVSSAKHGIGSAKHLTSSALCMVPSDSPIADCTLFQYGNSEPGLIIASNSGLSVMQLGTTSKVLADQMHCEQGVFLLQVDPAYKLFSVDSIPQSTVNQLVNAMKQKSSPTKWPITGGHDASAPIQGDFKLMISCHESGTVRFWASNSALEFWECVGGVDLHTTQATPVGTIIQTNEGVRVRQQSFQKVRQRVVTSLQIVDTNGVYIFVGCLNGEVVIVNYNFEKSYCGASTLIEMPVDIAHDQASNIISNCSDKVPTFSHWDSGLHGQATENQIALIRFAKPIQSIQVTSTLCAICDCDGYLALFDWANQFEFKAAYVCTQPISSLIFSHVAMVQASTASPQSRKPAIICILQSGLCYALVLSDQSVLSILSEPKKSKLEWAACVDAAGGEITCATLFQWTENGLIIPEEISAQLSSVALVMVFQTEIVYVLLEYPTLKKFKIDLKTPAQHAGLLSFSNDTKPQEPTNFLFIVQAEPQTAISILHWDGTVLQTKEIVACRLFDHDRVISFKDGNIVLQLSNASLLTTNIFSSKRSERVGCHLEPAAKPRKNSDSKSFFQQLKKLTSNTEDTQETVDYDSYFPETSSAVGTLKSEAQASENIMAKNLQALQERGEKLRNLEDKSADMANAAKDFLEMAKELKKSQQKPWYAL